MAQENNLLFQRPSCRRLGTVLALLLLAGCADSFDQTNSDLGASKEGMTHIAMQLERRGDVPGAVEFYQRALQRAPDDVAAHKGLARILEANGYNAEAAGHYQALARLQPDDAEILRAYGRALIKLNRPAEAKAQYEAALALDSDDTRALNGLGVALDLLGDHAGAQKKYRAALEEKPEDLVTLSNLAHSYVLAGNYGEAIKLLEPQAANPEAPAALRQNLAEAYGMTGMDVDAERMLKADLAPEQVKKTLAAWRASRVKTPAAAQVRADLGSFGTPALGGAYADKIKARFARDMQGLKLSVVPEVKEAGGTPAFYVRVNGFKSPAVAAAFCARLKKDGTFCKPE